MFQTGVFTKANVVLIPMTERGGKNIKTRGRRTTQEENDLVFPTSIQGADEFLVFNSKQRGKNLNCRRSDDGATRLNVFFILHHNFSRNHWQKKLLGLKLKVHDCGNCLSRFHSFSVFHVKIHSVRKQ